MASIDVTARGKDNDTALYQIVQTLTAQPIPVVLLGFHQQSSGLRALRTDTQGRLLVSEATQSLQIVNTVLPDAAVQVVTGAGVYRRCTFYAQNANMNLSFRLVDNSITAEITVVPNVPLVVEAVFFAVLAHNAAAGVIATLQAVIQSDPLAGQG